MKIIDLTHNSSLGQYSRRFLERCGREKALCAQRSFRNTHQKRLSHGNLATLPRHNRVNRLKVDSVNIKFKRILMSEFKIGDIVEAIKPIDGQYNLIGKRGKVVKMLPVDLRW